MTGRARWLMLIALIGMFIGGLRSQPTVALLSTAVFFWILVQWFVFQCVVGQHAKRLVCERTLNGRSKSLDSLWAGRSAVVGLALKPSQASGMSKVWQQILLRLPMLAGMNLRIHVRDVVPELLGILQNRSALDTLSRYSSSIRSGAEEVLANPPGSVQKKKKSSLISAWRWMTTDRTADGPQQLPPNEAEFDTSIREFLFGYSVRARAAGVTELPGVRLTVTDRFGFFRFHTFLIASQKLRVFPDYYHSGERTSSVKRFNSLPRHGIHRLQRAGMGSELLELREYVPGDPPKSIAWKVSARRDQLMTRQYESEVPVRVNLLIDGSVSTRMGGFGLRLMDQINYVAASVAKSTFAVGDPLSATLVDSERTRRLTSLSGDRGFMQLLTALAEFSNAPPPSANWLTAEVLEYAESTCRERYPDLMLQRYRTLPFSLFRSLRRRFRVAAVLAEVHGLSPREQYECYYDSGRFIREARKLLHACGMAWMPPLISTTRISSATAVYNMQLISKALTRDVTVAKDNQVFVILVDLLNCAPHVNELIESVKLALARHHRVAFVCPTTTFRRPEGDVIKPSSTSVADLLFASEQSRIRDLSDQLRRDLRRLAVPLSFSGETSAIRMVLSEIELTRQGKSRGSSGNATAAEGGSR